MGLLAIRLATVPLNQTSPVFAVIVVAVAVSVAVITIRALSRRNRLRAMLAAHPRSLVMPITIGVETAAATRWLADRLGDASLARRPDRDGIAIIDASGLRLAEGPVTSATIPVGKLSVLPLTTARVGSRRVEALALGIEVGDVVAPLPLVPVRMGFFAPGSLTDAELLDVSARIRDAVSGHPDTRGWDY